MLNINGLKKKVNEYHEVLKNTEKYREIWETSLKSEVIDTLNNIIAETGLNCTVAERGVFKNLDAIELSLGQTTSGMYEKVNEQVKRHLIKHNGSLIYQQLFNGKIIVLIHFPAIEGYGEPRPPKTIAIYRPEELTTPFIVRHIEELIAEVTAWEDYDDDEPHKKIGFQMNFQQESQQ